MVDRLKDIVLAGKADRGLGRMDIDVQQLDRHIQHQDAAREPALHGVVLEGHLQPGHHGRVADIAPVDVEKFHAAAGPAFSGRGDQAVQPVDALLFVDLDQVAGKLPAQHGVGRAAQVAVAGGDILLFALPDELEADLGVAEGQPVDDVGHIGALAGILFQELHPGGGVVEEVPHPDGGAHGAGRRLDGELFPALVAVEDGKLAGSGAGQQLDLGHAGDGGQCFPPEAQGADGGQVYLVLDLAGGVPDEGGGDVFRLDAAAVVADFDQLDAARLDGNSDLRRAGVDGVFDQFLGGGSRTLHHFARRDQFGGMFVQYADDCHTDTFLS